MDEVRAIRSSSRKLPTKRRTLFLTYRNLARKIYKLGRVHRWLPERSTIRAYFRKITPNTAASKRRIETKVVARQVRPDLPSPFHIRCSVYDSCDLRNAVELEQLTEKSKLQVERLTAQQSEICVTGPINLPGRSLQAFEFKKSFEFFEASPSRRAINFPNRLARNRLINVEKRS